MAISDGGDGAVFLLAESPAQIRLAEDSINKGDLIGYSGGWKRALATVTTVVQARCVAGEDGNSGQTIIAYFGDVKMVDRLSGGTAGASLYVAEGSASGDYTETAPTTTGDADTVIGEMLDAVTALVYPHRNAQSVA